MTLGFVYNFLLFENNLCNKFITGGWIFSRRSDTNWNSECSVDTHSRSSCFCKTCMDAHVDLVSSPCQPRVRRMQFRGEGEFLLASISLSCSLPASPWVPPGQHLPEFLLASISLSPSLPASPFLTCSLPLFCQMRWIGNEPLLREGRRPDTGWEHRILLLRIQQEKRNFLIDSLGEANISPIEHILRIISTRISVFPSKS